MTSGTDIQPASPATSAGGYYQIQEAFAKRDDLNWTAKGVYAILADRKRRGLSLQIGERRLSNLAGVDKSTAARALSQLIEKGLVAKIVRGNGQSCHYDVPEQTARKTQAVDRPQNTGGQDADRPQDAGGLDVGAESSQQADRPRNAPPTARETRTEPPVFCIPPHTPPLRNRTEKTENNLAAAGAASADGQGDLLPGEHADGTANGKAKDAQPDPRVALAIGYFAEAFERVHGRKPLIRGGKDGALLKDLLKRVDLPAIQGAVDTMLADPWGQVNASIGVLAGQWDKWCNMRAAGARATGGNGYGRSRQSAADWNRQQARREFPEHGGAPVINVADHR